MPSELPSSADSPPSGSAGFRDLRVEFGKGLIRLSGREWIAAGLMVAACLAWLPAVWKRHEPLETPTDYRVPYAWSEDYWTYRRVIDRIVATDRIPVMGDSFVWGEYVSSNETLSACLNGQTASDRFANVGLNGAHPLALDGLVHTYAANLVNRRVILHCNLLWMSSADRDLQSDKDMPFNHPRLVPQFVPRIPAYKASLSRRLGLVVDRSVPFFDLVDHVRTYWFDGQDAHTWSLANPYANPLSRLKRQPEALYAAPNQTATPWTKQGLQRQDLPWIDLDSSLQWQAWRRAAECLLARGNQVLVVVGPFNEHLLLEASRLRYRALKRQVEAWLRTKEIPFIAPALLPSEEYGDASHPLSAGYARVASGICADRAFQDWLDTRRSAGAKSPGIQATK